MSIYRKLLYLAAVYHMLWGGAMIFFGAKLAEAFQTPAGMTKPIWQVLGLAVLAFGLGYLLVARRPFRYWPIVLMTVILKGLAAAGIFLGLWQGGFSQQMIAWAIFNDLIWIPPLALLLSYLYHNAEGKRLQHLHRREEFTPARLADYRDQYGQDLFAMSQQSPVLLVFLRHFGCTFCRESLAELARKRQDIEAAGTRIVVVHMSDAESAARFFARYGLEDISRISDPSQELYRSFALQRGSFSQLFGWRSWLRGFRAGILKRHAIGWKEGDGFQMPGTFLVHHGRVKWAFRHEHAGDRPDYLMMGSCTLEGEMAA
jgi:peroxiredoxin